MRCHRLYARFLAVPRRIPMSLREAFEADPLCLASGRGRPCKLATSRQRPLVRSLSRVWEIDFILFEPDQGV